MLFQQLQVMKVPGCCIHYTSSDYFYVTPVNTSPSPLPKETSKVEDRRSASSCYTPPITPLQSQPLFRGHRRSSSWSVISSQRHSTQSLSGQNSILNMIASQAGVEEEDDVYVTSSNSSITRTSPVAKALSEPRFIFWLVLRVLPQNLEMYLQFR